MPALSLNSLEHSATGVRELAWIVYQKSFKHLSD
jgi:hypothetical protein